MTQLKVSKNKNDFMKTSVSPNNQEIIVRISTTNEIIVRISLVFGRNHVFIKPFPFLLTFAFIALYLAFC